MGLMRSEKIKLDYTKELFNTLIAEIKQYIKIVGDDCDEREKRVLDNILKYARLESEKDGEEYAVIQLFATEASILVTMLVFVGSIDVDNDKTDYYAQLKSEREQAE